jgi:glycosyltransferase involved in cell wall biosynthesis
MQKCVLMITRVYYPSNASGVHRSAANAKYLPHFGWTPVIVCKEFLPEIDSTYDSLLAAFPDICKVVRVSDTKNRVVKKAERMFWNVFGGGAHDYRCPYMLYHRMKKTSEQIVKSQKIDAIWTTYLPGLDHKIADYLSRKYGIPWVADFRDLPDQSYMNRNIRYIIKQEIKTCSSAKALIAATEELAEKLKARHKVPVYTVFNGFDPDEFRTSPKPGDYEDKFTINHFGVLYEFRNPSPLFAAIDRLSQQNKIELNDIRINFYGDTSKMVDGFAKSYRCASQVKTLNRLPYPEMVECQKVSQILLMVASPQQGGAIPAKLYSYLASGRPILNIPGDGAGTDRILQQAKAGVSLSKPEEIAVWLEQAYKNWKQTGIVEFSGDESEIQKYSRKTQAGQLAEILEKVTAHNESRS